MRITEFKKGDIIQRIKPTKRIGDHSYVGDRLEFLGFYNNVIFYRKTEGPLKDYVSTLDGFDWNDNGWDYFPDKQYKKILAEVERSMVEESRETIIRINPAFLLLGVFIGLFIFYLLTN